MLLTQRQELRRILKQHPTCQCLEVENDGKWYTVPTDRAYFLNFVYLRAGEEQVEHLYFSHIDVSDIKYMRDRKCRVVKNLEDDIYISGVFYIE